MMSLEKKVSRLYVAVARSVKDEKYQNGIVYLEEVMSKDKSSLTILTAFLQAESAAHAVIETCKTPYEVASDLAKRFEGAVSADQDDGIAAFGFNPDKIDELIEYISSPKYNN
jgi:hypothetical protein